MCRSSRTATRAGRADRRRRRLRHRRGGAQAQGGQARHAGRDRRLGGRVRQGAFPGIHRPGVPRQALRERDRRRHEIRRRDRPALRRHHRRLDRSAGAGRGAVHAGVLRRLQALHGAGRRDGDAERRAVLPAGRADLIGRHFSACSPMQAATSPRSRPMSAATWRWAGHANTGSCASIPATIAARYTQGRAASRPNTGRRRCTWRPSRCRASSPSMWQGEARTSTGLAATLRRVTLRFPEQPLGVAVGDAPRLVFGQLREPVAISRASGRRRRTSAR